MACSFQKAAGAFFSDPSLDRFGVTGSRILVSILLKMYESCHMNCNHHFQILHMDAGDNLELRMTSGDGVGYITLNIELTGLGFDYLANR